MWFRKKQKEDWTAIGENMWLIVGLGNPGKEYTSTFHNCGFMTLEVLAQKNNIKVDRLKWKGEYGRGTIQGEDCILLRPHTFMNLSGQSVIEVMKFFKIPLDHLIVIYDDIDIQRGKIRVRSSGSAGTHNGMKSVIQHLGTEEFPRVRIGTGPVPENWELVNYVLSEVPKDDRPMLNDAFIKACEAVEEIISNG